MNLLRFVEWGQYHPRRNEENQTAGKQLGSVSPAHDPAALNV